MVEEECYDRGVQQLASDNWLEVAKRSWRLSSCGFIESSPRLEPRLSWSQYWSVHKPEVAKEGDEDLASNFVLSYIECMDKTQKLV